MPKLIDTGPPRELGAHVHKDGVSFALFSAHADRVTLCLFDAKGGRETARIDLPGRSGDLWYGFLPGAKAGLVYGYRVHGPYAPHNGHRFNAHKLLLDPYARALAGGFSWTAAHYGYTLESGRPNDTFDTRDNAAQMWKARVLAPEAPLQSAPNIAWADTIICELHARGFTMRLPGLSAKERGTFAGLASTKALSYLKALGVTALELLPIHAFVDDHRLIDQGLKNFWGYNTLNYFTPHPAYAAGDGPAEMRNFVSAAHEAGFDVILDVVYNHTCEGDSRGPTLSFRGIDNASYYRLDPKDGARYADISGCGATLDITTPAMRRLVRDSLAHWGEYYGVDGFRFDIATSLGLVEDGGFTRDAPMFQEIAHDPRLKNKKLIAEAWDAAGGYQVGGFPKGWAEWNGKARDAIRRFWRGDERMAGEFAQRFAGSPDMYANHGRAAWAGVNYAACHDDFPLHDLTRFARKHNHANGEDNRDGPNHSDSCNYGHEGPTADPAINALRERQARNLLTSAILAVGTPMILAGDEAGRTQGGNNNAYAQDNEVSWIDWSLPETAEGASRVRFARGLLVLRKRLAEQLAKVSPRWVAPSGHDMHAGDWALPFARCFGAHFHAHGAIPATLIWFNAAANGVHAHMPPTNGAWVHVLDTDDPERAPGALRLSQGQSFEAPARSIFVFQSEFA